MDLLSMLPEAIRGEKAFEGVADVGALATNYLELQKKANGALAIPADDAPPEAREAFLTKLGRPAKPDDYKFDTPKLPDTIKDEAVIKRVTEDMKADLAEIKQLAFKLGLDPKRANALVDHYKEEMLSAYTKATKEVEAGLGGLKEEWGKGFEANMSMAGRVAVKFGGEEFAKLLKETGLSSNPVVLKALVKNAPTFSEEPSVDGKHAGDKGVTGDDLAKRLYPNLA